MIKYLPLLGLFVLLACSRGSLPKVELQTSMGTIVLEVDSIRAPVTAANFLKLVDAGVYANALFYRVVHVGNQPRNQVKIDVIQAGLNDDSRIEMFPTIAHETTALTGILHLDGTISMARNEPGTASTEFFICVGNQPELDFGGHRNPDGQGFAAFGRVLSGMSVVRAIQSQPEQSQMLDLPVSIYNIARIK